MWDVEINIAGYRFARRTPDHRRHLQALAPWLPWRATDPRRPHVA
jgi:hypothetical protein